MTKFTIEIEKIAVLQTIGTDIILITTTMPYPFKHISPTGKHDFKMECPKNHGAEYVRNNFGIEPQIIDAR